MGREAFQTSVYAREANGFAHLSPKVAGCLLGRGESAANGIELFCGYLPAGTRGALRELCGRESVSNVRLRAGQAVRAEWAGGDALLGDPIDRNTLSSIVSEAMEHSLYAWEDELGEGYFTLPGGSRVGVAGRFRRENGRVYLAAIGSVCVRAARAFPGCAREAVEAIAQGGRLSSAVVLAPPGLGKTTLLRDAARLLSAKGFRVGIADERGEIAACRNGIPAFDVGERTDVIDGIPKAEAMRRLVRSMSPDVVITDEIGCARDAREIREASRMGVCVIASAHASGVEDALRRPSLCGLMRDFTFRRAVTLGGNPGRIAEIREFDGEWKPLTR